MSKTSHDCTCKCVGKSHQLGCCCVDDMFASMLKPKRTAEEAEQVKVDAQDESHDEVIQARP